jgi:DNA-binding response OmpR family regulator
MASKILVVDDEPKWLRIVSLYLESRHYQVATALSGEEALEKIADDLPDVIIADIGMPGMDGYELCSRLRTTDRTRTIPFIFFTARDQDQDRIRARKIGSDDYLTKPCPLQRIAQSVESVMDRIEQARSISLSDIGLNGRLDDIDLLDLVQMLELQQRTGALLLSHGERTGTLYFQDGIIIQADIRSPKREEPLFVLLGWKTGRFMFLPDARPDGLPITASVANLLFQDLRTLEDHERVIPPSTTVPAPTPPAAVTLVQKVGHRLRSLHPSNQPHQIVRILIAGVSQSGASEVLQALVKDLSGERWAAFGMEEPWEAYRTEIGRVRISSDIVLHVIVVRAEKRFWPIWEQCLSTAQGVLLLLYPFTKDTIPHYQAFLRARNTLAPALPLHVVSPSMPDHDFLQATGLDTSQVSLGSPDDPSVRLTAMERLLRDWLSRHG